MFVLVITHAVPRSKQIQHGTSLFFGAGLSPFMSNKDKEGSL
ncbi:hypothetical protein UF75_2539 [Desulfosporosinus sp. I2]|nr:hypothetical protein UF75_2539 [Desulfosporosinus sp. I2]